MEIIIKIDGKEYPVERETFRTILVSAEKNLENMRRVEKHMFPRKDRKALEFISGIWAKHIKLITGQ